MLTLLMRSTARRTMRWTVKAILWLVVALLILAVAGAIYQTIATERAERAYPPPGEMVEACSFAGNRAQHSEAAGIERRYSRNLVKLDFSH
jgi:peptidoglycan/LPS O-acetylase OafA/YrhL